MSKILSRRQFLTGAAISAGAVLAACAPKVVTEYVEVEVPGEVITQTVEIEGETVTVERLVEVEVEVIRTAGEPYWRPPDLSGEEILIWGLKYDPHVETYERLGALFGQYTGATAVVEPQDWPIEIALMTGMAAGIVPDVCCILGAYIDGLIKEGAIHPLDDLIYDSVGCDTDTWFGQVALEAYKYDGQIWGVPTEGSCTSGVSNVRFDVLEDGNAVDMWPPNYGADGFKSFDEMWALAEAIQQTDEDGNVTLWGMSGEGWYPTQLFGIMRTLGVDWWDPETRTFQMLTDEALEALNLLAYRSIWELGVETHRGIPGTDAMMARSIGIANGNVAMPGQARDMFDGEFEVDTCAFPSAIPGRDALYVGEGGWGFVAPTQSENPELSIEFMKFLTTYEAQKSYAAIYGGLVSACVSVNYDDDLFPAGDLVGDAMRRSGLAQERTVYYGKGFGPLGDVIGPISTAAESVRMGEKMPEEALVIAQALMEEALARFDAEQ